jgi:hypothetical protein
VRRHLEAGKLRHVSDTPQFKLPAYLVDPGTSDYATLKLALDSFRELARAEQLNNA